jgi:predicted transcriptional regulator
MKIKEVMHKGVDWVAPDAPVTDLAKLMRQHDIGAIPIGESLSAWSLIATSSAKGWQRTASMPAVLQRGM